MKHRIALLGVLTAVALAQASPVLAQPAGLDDEFRAMAFLTPGFGGMFYDATGTPTVYLKDLQGVAAFQRDFPGVRVLEGKFDFIELSDWRAELRPLLALPGVVFLDVDEARNRVTVGVETKEAAKAADAVTREIERRGVPLDAVVVEAAEPIVPLVTLRDKIRPVPGGVQINFPGFLCTLGVNAYRSGVFGFLTNSHCTSIQGGVESTRYYQPTTSGGAIGTEIADPAYTTGSPCPSGRRCRWSDSSFARYDSASLGEFRKIARPDSRSTTGGSVTISGSFPRLTVIGKVQNPVAGEVLDKVGRTTGWSFGLVSSTCVDSNVANTNITLFCQSFVNAGVGSGDSGSPVFKYVIAQNGAVFYGLLWGSSSSTRFVMSPVSGIERELGVVTVY